MRFSGRTWQVWEVLVSRDVFTSAMEIHQALWSRGDTISVTAVYRSLHMLVDAGQVDVLLGPDGQHRYRRCSPTAHHHLLCRQCHRAVEVHDSLPGQLSNGRLRDIGFADDSIRITLVGLCADCSPT
ncbi:Fur family transcriptional regulator [Kibdelosporangium aridum]|nr:transcriptional repressor [Kibdelosporangium aridum]